MSTDFSQKERTFVAELEQTSGRDLDGWMIAITQAELSHRNEIIDWLRQHGFAFARASWIERIHHNGGKLIYGPTDAAPPREAARRKPKPDTAPPRPGAKAAIVQPAVVQPGIVQPDGEIDDLLAAAKAYRPLAQALLREILGAVPGADARGQGPLIALSFEHTFAAIWPSPKDVRLLLAIGDRPVGVPWVLAKRPAGLDGLSSLSHMIILTDARQLTGDIMGLVAAIARTKTR